MTKPADFRTRITPNIRPRREELQAVIARERMEELKDITAHTEGWEVDDYARPPKKQDPVVYFLRLPLPPSANDLVRPAVMRGRNGKPTARLVKAGGVRGWHDVVRAAVGAGHGKIHGPAYLHATMYFRSVSSDLSNRIKALEDGLTAAGVWFDDAQVVRLECEKALAPKGVEPYCEVRAGAYWVPDPDLRMRLTLARKAGGGS